MATPTYEPIQSQTLSSSVPTVTFSSVPQNYTDLILVINGGITAANWSIRVRFNGVSTSVYSQTAFAGSGSSGVVSDRASSATSIAVVGGVNGLPGNSLNNVGIIQIQNYANNSTFKTILTRTSSAAQTVEALVGNWASTNPITQIDLFSGSGNLFAGSTFTLYGVLATDSSSSTPKASGGTITTDMLYTYHTFTAGGTFTPSQDLTADVLIVGGGGGSGDANAGGGGAGGVIYAPARSFTNATAYTAVIGAGGGANAGGVASTFSGLSATGGGYSIGEGSPGTNGGSGGGGGGGGGSNSRFTPGISTGSSGAGFTFFGNSGGIGLSNYNSGGGGGAGGVGQEAKGNSAGSGAGNGGIGLATWSSWLTATNTGHNVSGLRYIAGGGGGGANTGPVGVGGLGGGGTGKSDSSTGTQTPGTVNTGGGAGGSGGISSRGGTNGGSGLIIIRYPKA